MKTLVLTTEQLQSALNIDPPDVVEIGQTPNTVVVVEPQQPQIVEVVAVGPQGPMGPPSNNATSIVGYPVSLISGQPDDLLSFTGAEWTNKPQINLTDGGNF